MAQTLEDFLKTVRANQLGADGRFLGPQSGTAYYAEGLTPEQFYKRHLNDQKDTGRFTGSGDNMQAEMESAGPVSADWVEGPTGNRGLFGGVSDMMTNPKTLMGLLAMGGIGALTGFGGAGAAGAAGAGEAAGFSGIGGTGGAAGIGSGTALGGAELAGAGLGAGEAAGAGLASLGGAGEAAAGFSGIGGTGGAAGIGSGTAFGGAGAAGTAGAAGAGGSLFSKAGSFLSDPSNLLKVGGTVLGAIGGAAASGDKTTSNSSSRDPWAPAQPYLIDNLKTNANAQEFYRQNPFSDLQKQQYQNAFNSLANSQANIPGLLANASSFGKSNRGVMPAMQGLLSGTQAAPINWDQYANIGRRG